MTNIILATNMQFWSLSIRRRCGKTERDEKTKYSIKKGLTCCLVFPILLVISRPNLHLHAENYTRTESKLQCC